jgi:hypothetical protein
LAFTIPSFVFGTDPAEVVEGLKTKAQWAETHGFTWFSVMDHLIQIPPVGQPDEREHLGALPGRFPPPPIWLTISGRRCADIDLWGV